MTSGYRAVGDEPQGSYTHGPSATWRPRPALVRSAGLEVCLLGLGDERIGPRTDPDCWRADRTTLPTPHRRTDRHGCRALGTGATLAKSTWSSQGSGSQGKHVRITAREAARRPALFLNRGNWNGRAIAQRRNGSGSPPRCKCLLHFRWGTRPSSIDGRGVYGFNWWSADLQPRRSTPPSRPARGPVLGGRP